MSGSLRLPLSTAARGSRSIGTMPAFRDSIGANLQGHDNKADVVVPALLHSAWLAKGRCADDIIRGRFAAGTPVLDQTFGAGTSIIEPVERWLQSPNIAIPGCLFSIAAFFSWLFIQQHRSGKIFFAPFYRDWTPYRYWSNQIVVAIFATLLFVFALFALLGSWECHNEFVRPGVQADVCRNAYMEVGLPPK